MGTLIALDEVPCDKDNGHEHQHPRRRSHHRRRHPHHLDRWRRRPRPHCRPRHQQRRRRHQHRHQHGRKILNSRQIKEMNAAFERDKDITLKLEAQIEEVRRFKESAHLTILVLTMQSLLGPDHLLVVLLRGILVYDLKSAAGMSSGLPPKAPVSLPKRSSPRHQPLPTLLLPRWGWLPRP